MTSTKKTPAKKKTRAPAESPGVGDVALVAPPAEAPAPKALAVVPGPRRSPFATYQSQVLGSALAQVAPGASFDEKALRKHWRGGTEPREVAQSVLAGLGPQLPALPPAPHDIAALGCPPDVRDANPVAPSSYDTAYAKWHTDASYLAGGAVDHVRGRAAWKKGMGPEDFARLENPRAQIRPLRDDEGEFRRERPQGYEPRGRRDPAAPGFIHEKRSERGRFREANPLEGPGGELGRPSMDLYDRGYRHAERALYDERDLGHMARKMTARDAEIVLDRLLGYRPSAKQIHEYIAGHDEAIRDLRRPRRRNPEAEAGSVGEAARSDNPVRRGDDGRFESREEQEEERRERARRRHNPLPAETLGRHDRPITLDEWLRDHPERSEMRPVSVTEDGVPVYRFRPGA